MVRSSLDRILIWRVPNTSQQIAYLSIFKKDSVGKGYCIKERVG